jgi:hypothetical protein
MRRNSCGVWFAWSSLVEPGLSPARAALKGGSTSVITFPPEIGAHKNRLFGDELCPALADRVDHAVGVEGMVVGLDQRAAIGRHPLVVVLVAGLDDLAGGRISELLLVKGVKRRGMGGSVDAILPGAVGADGMIGAVLQVLLERPCPLPGARHPEP